MTARRKDDWVDWAEWDATLSKMWYAGTPLAAIAKAIPGSTANSISKRAARIPLAPRSSPILSKAMQTKRANAALGGAAGARIASMLGKAHRKAIEAPPRVDYKPPHTPTPTKCQWPLVDRRPWLFCEAAVEHGSYCAAHGAVAYTPPSDWAKQQAKQQAKA